MATMNWIPASAIWDRSQVPAEELVGWLAWVEAHWGLDQAGMTVYTWVVSALDGEISAAGQREQMVQCQQNDEGIGAAGWGDLAVSGLSRAFAAWNEIVRLAPERIAGAFHSYEVAWMLARRQALEEALANVAGMVLALCAQYRLEVPYSTSRWQQQQASGSALAVLTQGGVS